MSLARKLVTSMKYSKRVRLAAEQMYKHVQAGRAFEVPNGPGTDDLVVRSVLCLREMYPDVPVVYQARTVIIGRVDKTMKVGKEAWDLMEKGRYLPPAALAQNAERFLDDQAQWLASQGLDRNEEITEGQRRQAARDALVLAGGKVANAERTAVPKRQLTPEELLEQAAEAAQHKAALEKEALRRAELAKSGAPMPRGSNDPQPHMAFIDQAKKEETAPVAPMPSPGDP